MNKFYVTTPIYYVNDEPHIGHLYTTTIADIIARAKRKMGYDVLFSTGTDENADKVKRVADEKGIDTKIFVDNLSESFKKTFLDFNISFDRFIRTTEKNHEEVVKYFFRKLYENGFIYKGLYEGWYCVYDETFFSEDELLPGNNENKKIINYNGYKVIINLKFRIDDFSKVPIGYEQYWFDNIEKMLNVTI